MKTQRNILIVDDNPNNLRLLTQILVEQDYKVRAVLNGTRALAAVQSTHPDIILLDIMMPEMDGYKVCARLQADPLTADIPVIFISALGETEDKIRAFEAGGVDYVTKPFQADEVLARLETHLMLRDLRGELELANARLEEQVIVLNDLNAQLQAQNEELDAFAHTVAHDIKNPLNLVMGHAELLLHAGEKLSTPGLESARAIMTAGRKINNITEALMVLHGARKAEDVRVSPLDMAGIVREARSRIEDLIAGEQVDIVLPQSWPVVWGYGPWIEEVWANYLSNAIKYGGEPPRIELGATELAGGRVRFWVRDNGVGLTAEEQAQLFIPFGRLEQARIEGHGLGLSIVRRIVEKLGGEVGIESAPGEGSTFSFTLPHTPPDVTRVSKR